LVTEPVSTWEPSPTQDPLSYPGRIPPHSFVVADGDVVRVDNARDSIDSALAGAPASKERVAVLAVGSNAAPARLAEKGLGRPLAALRVTVRDHVAVYSAHVSRYGAVASTLHEEPGAWCKLHVTLFDEAQLAAVDRTEGNYERVDLAEHHVDGLGGLGVDRIQRYASGWGALQVGGAPVRLSEIPSGRSRLPALSQRGIQRRLVTHARRHGLPVPPTARHVCDAIGANGLDARSFRPIVQGGLP
jgi:hypothetical protein